MEEVIPPNPHPETDPPPAWEEGPAAGPHDDEDAEGPTCYPVCTPARPTARLLKHGATAPAQRDTVKCGSIRVGMLPKSARLLRTPALSSPVEPGWTRPAAVKPLVTRNFSGLRIRAGMDQ